MGWIYYVIGPCLVSFVVTAVSVSQISEHTELMLAYYAESPADYLDDQSSTPNKRFLQFFIQ